jgi:hypothetical protein
MRIDHISPKHQNPSKVMLIRALRNSCVPNKVAIYVAIHDQTGDRPVVVTFPHSKTTIGRGNSRQQHLRSSLTLVLLLIIPVSSQDGFVKAEASSMKSSATTYAGGATPYPPWQRARTELILLRNLSSAFHIWVSDLSPDRQYVAFHTFTEKPYHDGIGVMTRDGEILWTRMLNDTSGKGLSCMDLRFLSDSRVVVSAAPFGKPGHVFIYSRPAGQWECGRMNE